MLLVDAPSLYFRAFHGIPIKAALTQAGEPVNAVRGFLDMMATLIRTRRPGRVVCALDYDWRPAWRVKLIPSYKAYRLAPGGGPSTEVVPDNLEAQALYRRAGWSQEDSLWFRLPLAVATPSTQAEVAR